VDVAEEAGEGANEVFGDMVVVVVAGAMALDCCE